MYGWHADGTFIMSFFSNFTVIPASTRATLRRRKCKMQKKNPANRITSIGMDNTYV